MHLCAYSLLFDVKGSKGLSQASTRFYNSKGSRDSLQYKGARGREEERSNSLKAMTQRGSKSKLFVTEEKWGWLSFALRSHN